MPQNDDPKSGNTPDALRTQIIEPKQQTGPVLVPTLQVIDGPLVGSLHRFKPREENTMVIGRTDEAEFVLAHPTLSRCHARFTWTRVRGQFYMLVEDLQSTNGTTVNGVRVEETFLKEGDRVGLGDAMLRFQMLSPVELEERDRLIAKAQEAEVDQLTGLGTRNHMEERVPRLFAECEMREIPLSLLILDLDHFKRVNDTFGHQAGDRVLQVASRIVKGNTRPSDTSIRFGGEEILVLLPGAPLVGAQVVAERVRCAMQDFDAGTIGPSLSISVSIGVAERAAAENFESLLRRADAALYRAKEHGRNRVEIDASSNQPPAPATKPEV